MKYFIFILCLFLSSPLFAVTCNDINDWIPRIEVNAFNIKNNSFNGVHTEYADATLIAREYETKLNGFIKITSIQPGTLSSKIHYQLTNIDQLLGILDRCIGHAFQQMSCEGEWVNANGSLINYITGNVRPHILRYEDSWDKLQKYHATRNFLSQSLPSTNDLVSKLSNDRVSTVSLLKSRGYDCYKTQSSAINHSERSGKEISGGTQTQRNRTGRTSKE